MSESKPTDDPTFFCDAMHGGLARWLRAAGYDTAWQYGIEDKDLVDRAKSEGRVILTSDAPLMKDKAILQGEPRALFVPRGLGPTEALAFVLRSLGLAVRDPRCMVCSGRLTRVPKESVVEEVLPKTYAAFQKFFRCTGCKKVFWEGTHWQSIEERLSRINEGAS